MATVEHAAGKTNRVSSGEAHPVVTYLIKPRATSHMIGCIQEGHSSMTLCGRFVPDWERRERKPYRVCGQCQRAARRIEAAAKAGVA